MSSGSLNDALATLNACLNGAAAVLVVGGFLAIRRKRVAVHRGLMLTALLASVVFLASYLTRMAVGGSHVFVGPAWLRAAYLVLLVSHVTLAMTVPPLVGWAVYLAATGRIDRHRRIVRWALPTWLYVSVTGVTIYVMLYHVSQRG
jgi:putative membrane protein